MKLASSFSFGITLVLAAKIAPVCAATPLVPPPTAQEILIDQWSDADYQLSCKRPANTILIPAAIPNIEGRAGVVKLSSGNFSGTVRGLDAPKGAEGILMEFISESLERAEGGPGFEFRKLPIGGGDSERSFGELVPFLGEQALCIRLLDERPERQLVFELRIIERNGIALRFVVSGPLAAIHEDGRGFEPFFNAFSLSKGEFKHRATPPNAPDFDGPGYTVRGGVLASGELGLRMEAPEGWRIEPRLLAMDWSFASHALFVSPDTEGRVTVGTNVYQRVSPPEAPADQANPSLLNFAGQQVAIKEVYPSGSRGRLRVQQGVLEVPEGQDGPVEAQLQLVLDREHIKSLEPAIQEALASATRLSAAESAEIISHTTGPNDPQVGIGKQAWFRGGTYFSRAHGLRWTPPEGVWINLIEPSKQYAMDRDTLLMSYNHGRNLICELRAKASRSKDLERVHRRGLQRALDVSRVKSKDAHVEEGEFLGHQSMRTRGRSLLGTGALDFTTILMDGHAIHVSVSSTIECSDELAESLQAELQAIRDALVLAPELKVAQASDGRFADLQFGFAVDLTGEAWTVQPQEARSDQGPPQVQAQFVRDDGLTMTLSARWVDPIGYLDDRAFARHRGLYEAARNLAFQGGEIRDGGELAHQGRTVHVVRSRDQGIEWETAVLQRGPFVYTINAWNTDDPKAKLLSDVMDRITFND